MAGWSSTGDASAYQASNPNFEIVGRRKAAGRNFQGPAMPPYEEQLPLLVEAIAALREEMKFLGQEYRKSLWYSDPATKYIPVTLDPQVQNVLRYEGRWYSGIWLPQAGQIDVQVPGAVRVTIQAVAGWNMLNQPEGTLLFVPQTASRIPGAWIVVSNKPIAGFESNASVALLASPTTNIGTTGSLSDYPQGAIPLAPSSGNQANATATATLAANTTKTTYITGFQVDGAGATGALAVSVTVTGTISGTLTYTYVFVAGVTTPNTPLLVTFPKAIPGTGVNTAIVVSCPASGLGGTNNTVNAQGYQL